MIRTKKKFEVVEDGIYRLRVSGFRHVPDAPFGPSDAVDFVVLTEGKHRGAQVGDLIGPELISGTKYDKYVTAINGGVPIPEDSTLDTDTLIGREVDAVVKIVYRSGKGGAQPQPVNKIEALIPVKAASVQTAVPAPAAASTSAPTVPQVPRAGKISF